MSFSICRDEVNLFFPLSSTNYLIINDAFSEILTLLSRGLSRLTLIKKANINLIFLVLAVSTSLFYMRSFCIARSTVDPHR